MNEDQAQQVISLLKGLRNVVTLAAWVYVTNTVVSIFFKNKD